ncbi:MAG: 2-phospho-L-lactate guanylyltransferase [Acidobacteria bacterium]|nr:MAG: 2-phospho-L-lactate guanylyltransferase [Acidobacteriota bacterium]
MRCMAAVLIPVKDPGHAKQRLRGELTQRERTELTWAKLTDLASAVRRAKRPDAVFVVTSSPRVEAFAHEQGWDLLTEETQLSESSSIDWASGELKRRGIGHVFRLPGDIPLVQPSDIDEVIEIGYSEQSSVIVPSRDGTGTNGLLRTPPDAFPSRFGPDSFRLHHQEAGSRRLPLLTLPNERLGLDIDDPEDLTVFLDRSVSGHTLDFLVSIGARRRLENATA